MTPELHLFTHRAAAIVHGFGGLKFTLKGNPHVSAWVLGNDLDSIKGRELGRVVVHRQPYLSNIPTRGAKISDAEQFQRAVFEARLYLRLPPMEYVDDA